MSQITRSNERLKLEIMSKITSQILEAIERFMRATDSMVPTDDIPKMEAVEEKLEFYDSLTLRLELDYAEAIKKECMMEQFKDDWCQAFHKCFERKHGTETTNVNFYVKQANEILDESGLASWEMEDINEPFIDRISNLEYLANWFDNAEDAQSVLKCVY